MDRFANFAKAALASGITSGATTLDLASGEGARFPAVPFNATVWNFTDFTDPSDDPDREIVRVTGIATDTLTITRGQEGTSGVAHNTGGKVYRIVAGLTAKTMAELRAVVDVLDSTVTRDNNTFTEILSVPVDTGATYLVRVVLHIDGTAASYKARLNGTVAESFAEGVGLFFSDPDMAAARITAIPGTFVPVTGAQPIGYATFDGMVGVTTGGTLTVEVAQFTTDAGAPFTVLVGSYLQATPVTA